MFRQLDMAEENNHELVTSELKAKEASMKLAEEVNKLQFELQWRESSFMDSQQTWAQRFDRMVVVDVALW
nr:hypothetical protein BaRGS_015965 [Batillaria attramentaria]